MYKINRAFIGLFLFTFGVVFLTWILLRGESERLAQKNFEPFLLYPQLAKERDQIKIMQLEVGRGLSGTQKITLWREKKGDAFRIYQAGDYFASPTLANRLFYGTATLKAEGARGNQQEQLEKLGLIKPEKLGPATRIVFYTFERTANKKYKKRLSLLVGNRPEKLGDVFGQSSIFVSPEQGLHKDKTFLVRGSLPLRTQVRQWVDLDFFQNALNALIDGKPFQLAKGQFSLHGKAGWILKRATPQSAFALTTRRGVPLIGIYDERRIAAIERNLKQIKFQAVRPLDTIAFKRPHIVILESFSGLVFIFEIVRTKTGFWAKINARATSVKAQNEAQKVRAHLENFAFQLPEQVARNILVRTQQLKKVRARR